MGRQIPCLTRLPSLSLPWCTETFSFCWYAADLYWLYWLELGKHHKNRDLHRWPRTHPQITWDSVKSSVNACFARLLVLNWMWFYFQVVCLWMNQHNFPLWLRLLQPGCRFCCVQRGRENLAVDWLHVVLIHEIRPVGPTRLKRRPSTRAMGTHKSGLCPFTAKSNKTWIISLFWWRNAAARQTSHQLLMLLCD